MSEASVFLLLHKMGGHGSLSNDGNWVFIPSNIHLWPSVIVQNFFLNRNKKVCQNNLMLPKGILNRYSK